MPLPEGGFLLDYPTVFWEGRARRAVLHDTQQERSCSCVQHTASLSAQMAAVGFDLPADAFSSRMQVSYVVVAIISCCIFRLLNCNWSWKRCSTICCKGPATASCSNATYVSKSHSNLQLFQYDAGNLSKTCRYATSTSAVLQLTPANFLSL